MNLAIFGNFTQDAHCATLEGFFDAATRHADRLQLFVEGGFRDYLNERGVNVPARASVLTAESLLDCDMAVSFGGDGTFLRVAARIAPLEIPIVGINTGHLGYLASVSPDNPERTVSRILAGRYRVEDRAMLSVSTVDDEGGAGRLLGIALNEVAVLKQDTASMVVVKAHLNSHKLADYHADGLLVSTPTGSTGYNLSVGGPIVEPGTGVWMLSPIAAHTLTMRPMVVADTSEIVLEVDARSGSFLLSFDGNSLTLPSGSVVKVSKASFVTKIVLSEDRTFADSLREKLLWGV